MSKQFRKIKNVLKIILISFVIVFTFIVNTFTTSAQFEIQAFDLESATVISIGFGTAFCMVISNLKKG